MTDGTLPDELAHLEQMLQRLPLPVPSAGLRLRSLAEVRRVRARGRIVLLAAAAAVVLVVGGLWASRPSSAGGARLHRSQPELVRIEARALEGLGWAADDAQRLALVVHTAALPRLAPPMGSGASPLPTDGGL